MGDQEISIINYALQQGGLAAVAITALLVIRFMYLHMSKETKERVDYEIHQNKVLTDLLDRTFMVITKNTEVMQNLVNETRSLYELIAFNRKKE